jgi:hypothetical protein
MTLRKRISLRSWFLAAVVTFSLMLLTLPALAGRVQIRDPGGLFNPADISALHGQGGEYPFDVRVIASSEHDQKADFDRLVRAQVNAPNVVVIGIDPKHRFTSVHFGTGLGVPPSQFKAIEHAGSPHFKEGNWRSGVEAILKETRQASHGPAASGEAARPRSTAGTTVFYGLIGLLVVGGVIALVASILSRRAREAQVGPPGYPPGQAPGPYPPGGGPYPPGYGPGPYGPGYGGSGMGTNIASAALGGLAGYQLGKMAGEHHEHGHDRENQAGVVGGNEPENHDGGGSTGSWDDDAGGGNWSGGDDGGGDWGGGGDGGGSDW